MRLIRSTLIVIAIAACAACLWAWRDMVKRESGSVFTRRLTPEEEALVGSYVTVGGIDSVGHIAFHADRTTEHRALGMTWDGGGYRGHW